MNTFLATCLVSISVFTTLSAQAQVTETTPVAEMEQDFQRWLVDFKIQAVQAGISSSTLSHAFADVHLNQKVLELDRRQPEFTSTFFEYYNRAVSDQRIQSGVKNLKKHRKLLHEVTQKYGVPERILVAFWGMETNYGSYTGNIPIIESLATLSYDPRRRSFFSKQLINALQIIDLGYVTPKEMKGSWAGAMGQCQFMPSNYLKYAVDGDGDGKINLWDSLPDALYSAGHFLEQLGWQKEQNWGREVHLPEDFDYALADGKTQRSLKEWQTLGIKQANNRSLSTQIDMPARLLLASDFRGPAFLVYDNFKVIKRWNNSDKYAIGIGRLADRIVGKPLLTKSQPKDDKGLSTAEMQQIQTLLNTLGYDVGEADGIAGSRTKKALRNFQIKNQLAADGYPSIRMLNLLQHTLSANKDEKS
ncbi:lytic murein transglycosylase [Thiomicrorhabdus arctica]|uniref:lytic murein transglycosylase n=1 Tax=Thiomicrorhabdus arctica TaxID=131540 RepID=UPI000367A537|nr:lytic murein transglycosylase [Thiomicrorhabdus arctica]